MCFDAWSELHAKEPSPSQDIINEIIWNNRCICIDNKSICRRDIVDLIMSCLKIGDLISTNSFASNPRSCF